jgi:hypothetical protein
MPRGDYRLTVSCSSGTGCRESAMYSYPTRAEYADGYKRHHGKWKCLRHDYPEKLLAGGNEAVSVVLTASRLPYHGKNYDRETGTWTEGGWLDGLFWLEPGKTSGSGLTTGPGFRAFASDWPEGTRLEITARILPPEGTGNGN